MQKHWFGYIVSGLLFLAACTPPDLNENIPLTISPVIATETINVPSVNAEKISTQAIHSKAPELILPPVKTAMPTKILTFPSPSPTMFSGDLTQPFEPIFDFPLAEGKNQVINSSYRYGSTQNGARLPHDGVEFYNEYGTAVVAALDGTILFAGNDENESWGRFKNFYGNLVVIEHAATPIGQRYYTLYAHLSKIDVKTGDFVFQGKKIGEIGFSGGAIGSHLHFEVRVGQPLLENSSNPELYLPLNNALNNGSVGVLAGQILDTGATIVEDANISIQPMRNGKIDSDQIATYLSSYTKTIPHNTGIGENFLISNLPEGDYRLTVFISGSLQEKFVKILTGQITFITVQKDN